MSSAYTSIIKVVFNEDVDLFMITNRFYSFERKIILLKSNGWVGMKVTDYVVFPLMSLSWFRSKIISVETFRLAHRWWRSLFSLVSQREIFLVLLFCVVTLCYSVSPAFAIGNDVQHTCTKAYEPRQDKTNKVSVRPAKTPVSLGIRPI